MVDSGRASKMAKCGQSAGLPYRFKANGEVYRLYYSDNTDSYLSRTEYPSFDVQDYRPPLDEVVRPYRQRPKQVPGKERLHQYTSHLLRRQPGLREEVPSKGILLRRLTSVRPMDLRIFFQGQNSTNMRGFCGHACGFPVHVYKERTTISIFSQCPDLFAPFSSAEAAQSQAVLFCTNLPVVCDLYPLVVKDSEQLATRDITCGRPFSLAILSMPCPAGILSTRYTTGRRTIPIIRFRSI
jgi:hypothetical protein